MSEKPWCSCPTDEAFNPTCEWHDKMAEEGTTDVAGSTPADASTGAGVEAGDGKWGVGPSQAGAPGRASTIHSSGSAVGISAPLRTAERAEISPTPEPAGDYVERSGLVICDRCNIPRDPRYVCICRRENVPKVGGVGEEPTDE